MNNRASKLLAIIVSTLALSAQINAAPPTEDEVGDVGSFGHAALYMGAKSGFIQFSDDPCAPPPTPDPNTRCFQFAPAPLVATFDAPDILTISLPKRATRTIIYPALNFFVSYQLRNTTGVPQDPGVFAFTALVTIESDALLDPSIIDPATSLPANGKLVNQFTYRYIDDRYMNVNDRQRTQITLTRVGNAGINKAQLIAQGLSPAVVDNLFTGPMKLHMSITGRTAMVTDASLTANMRLFGD